VEQQQSLPYPRSVLGPQSQASHRGERRRSTCCCYNRGHSLSVHQTVVNDVDITQVDTTRVDNMLPSTDVGTNGGTKLVSLGRLNSHAYRQMRCGQVSYNATCGQVPHGVYLWAYRSSTRSIHGLPQIQADFRLGGSNNFWAHR